MSYDNPPENIYLRGAFPQGSDQFGIMLNILHDQAKSSQSLYYCATHHSIETVTTHKHHKGVCKTFTKGIFSCIFIFYFLLHSLALEKKDTLTKFVKLCTEHGHIDAEGKVRAILFTKLLPQPIKIQKKKKPPWLAISRINQQ